MVSMSLTIEEINGDFEVTQKSHLGTQLLYMGTQS